MKTVAIIGGGFSGLMSAVNLIHKTEIPLAITIFEPASLLGQGFAYSTHDPVHFLNVQAKQMGAFANHPDHFYHWLKALRDIEENQYLPRMIYASYLQEIWKDALRVAAEKGLIIKHIKEKVDDIREVIADKVILCTGVPENKTFSVDSPHYIPNFWHCESSFFAKLPADTSVAILGTGLTMIDVVLSLDAMGYPGQIIAISPHGQLPKKHQAYAKNYTFSNQAFPHTALGLFRWFKKELRLAQKEGYDWRAVIDALRPYTSKIWRKLAWKERKSFVRYLLSLWNRHRHRTSSQCMDKITQLIEKKRLKIKRGRVSAIKKGEKLEIYYNSPAACEKVDYIINCTGPQMDVLKNPSLLFKNLLKNNLIIVDPLHLGVQSTEEGLVKGSAQGKIYAVGQILFGEFLETTAVPELRQQCARVAEEILNVFAKNL